MTSIITNLVLNLLHELQNDLRLVVSTTFALVYFLSLNESTCQTRKNAFYFISKALFILENQILKFCIFKCHDVIKCLCIKQEIHFTELLKWFLISTIAKLVHNLPHVLRNDLWLRVSGNQKILEKCEMRVEMQPTAQSFFNKRLQ